MDEEPQREYLKSRALTARRTWASVSGFLAFGVVALAKVVCSAVHNDRSLQKSVLVGSGLYNSDEGTCGYSEHK